MPWAEGRVLPCSRLSCTLRWGVLSHSLAVPEGTGAILLLSCSSGTQSCKAQTLSILMQYKLYPLLSICCFTGVLAPGWGLSPGLAVASGLRSALPHCLFPQLRSSGPGFESGGGGGRNRGHAVSPHCSISHQCFLSGAQSSFHSQGLWNSQPGTLYSVLSCHNLSWDSGHSGHCWFGLGRWEKRGKKTLKMKK